MLKPTPDTLIYFKMTLAALLALTNLVLFRLLNRNTPGIRYLKIMIWGIYILKVAGILYIYAWQKITVTSDAVNFYLPESLAIIKGQVPDIDYSQSYSFLFPYLITLFVYFWRSAGAICLLMTAVEGLMVWWFIKTYRLPERQKYKAALLYLTSFLSFYIVSFTGYNGIIVCCALIFSFSFADSKKKAGWKHFFFQAGFWLSKLLILLYIPVIAISGAKTLSGVIRRSVPFLVTISLLFILYRAGIHVQDPVMEQKYQITACNLPFFVLIAFPHINMEALTLANLVVFLAVSFFICLYFFYKGKKIFDNQFIMFCFASVLSLAFLTISKKAFVQYNEMYYFVLIITLLIAFERPFKYILLVNVLNFLMPVELFLERRITIYTDLTRFKPLTYDAGDILLILIDIIILSIYMYFIFAIMKSVGRKSEAMGQLAPQEIASADEAARLK